MAEGDAKRARIESADAVKCIDTVRVLCADVVEKANSGHPGAPMGCAPIGHVLFAETMTYSPSNPQWSNRDRFVLSNGHACALLYSLLHLTGYDIGLEDLKKFRQLSSRTPGHPENFVTPGVEVSTGPLGQGISNAVGMAISERQLAATYNKEGFPVVDHFTFVLCGDGCLQEGISSEASSLAGHLGLGKLIVCYDDNLITIDGETNLSFTEDVIMRYNAYNWHVQTVTDVNDLEALRGAIAAAKLVTDRPSLIKIRTVIGFGSKKEGTEATHGAPLGAADLSSVKERFGFNPTESFVVPDAVRHVYESRGKFGGNAEREWNEMFVAYGTKFPEQAAEFHGRMQGQLPSGWKEGLPVYSPQEAKAVATRNRSEEVLNYIASRICTITGGSADLTPSNLTALKCSGDFQKETPAGRYIRFGVREHAMAAICNGMFAYGGQRPFCATFLNFIGYALGAVRLSALSRFGVVYVMTHDSIGLGEDGPTHQPVEMLECLRATPNLLVFRPADGNETAGAYAVAMEHAHTPSVISLSRQATPTLEGSAAEKVYQGAYVLCDVGASSSASSSLPTLVLVATGTEVALAVSTAQALAAASAGMHVRVVSMPCCELFDEQSLEYQLSVFPEGAPVMSIEAAGVAGWKKYAHAPFGLTTYGLSAPGPAIMAHFGFTVSNLVERANEVVAFYESNSAPSLLRYPKFVSPAAPGH